MERRLMNGLIGRQLVMGLKIVNFTSRRVAIPSEKTANGRCSSPKYSIVAS